MKRVRRPRLRPGFTLVEMMVVVAIIALLLAVLLPAFSLVRNNARKTQAAAQFTALDMGIQAFAAEASLGGTLPPSASDNLNDRQLIAMPISNSASTTTKVAGAHLLVMAMIGADGLGTPGFKDLDSPPNGWWDNTHKGDPGGIYFIDVTTGKEKYPRYGAPGYVDEKMRDRAKSLKELQDKGKLVGGKPEDLIAAGGDVMRAQLPVFLDPWDNPILYYRASPSTTRMITDLAGTNRGIYTQQDNGLITGTASGTGLDFGAGMENNFYHSLAIDNTPAPTDPITPILQEPVWNNTFTKFILDAGVKARPTPVKRDSYLLIAAGQDNRYGTDDDITNWPREKK